MERAEGSCPPGIAGPGIERPGVTGLESWRSLSSLGMSAGSKDPGNVSESPHPLLEEGLLADCYERVQDLVGQRVWSRGRVRLGARTGFLAVDLGRERRRGM